MTTTSKRDFLFLVIFSIITIIAAIAFWGNLSHHKFVAGRTGLILAGIILNAIPIISSIWTVKKAFPYLMGTKFAKL